jgi:hypothetical protein
MAAAMHRSPLALPGLFFVVALAAGGCGARSGLEAAGAGGSGASTTSSSGASSSTAIASTPAASSSGSSGGGGAAPAACKPGDPPVVVVQAPSSNALALDAFDLYVAGLQTDVVGRAPKTGGAFEVIAKDVIAPWYVAVDATALYWASACAVDPCGIFSAPKGGGAPTTIAAVPSPFAIVVDDTTVFYTHTGLGPEGVARVSKQGGAVTELAQHLAHPVGLAIDDAYVYWAAEDDGTIGRVSKQGGAPELVATSGVGVWPLAVDGERVYWGVFTAAGYIASAPKSGGAESVLVTGLDQPVSVAVDEASIFVAVLGFGPCGGQILEVPKPSGAPKVIADNEPDPTWVAVDDSCVYWSRIDGTIKRAPK